MKPQRFSRTPRPLGAIGSAEMQTITGLGVLIGEFSEVVERFQVIGNFLADVWPLNLDRDTTTVAKNRAMYLAKRCGRDRCFLENSKRLG